MATFSGIAKAFCWQYLPQKTTMCETYYAEMLRNPHQAVKKRQREMLTTGPLLQPDNAPTHMSRVVAQAVVKDLGPNSQTLS